MGLLPNVFKGDFRQAVTAIETPTKWVGKLTLPGGGWCTAGLIQRDLIITAAHCVVDSGKHAFIPGDYVFSYGVVDYDPADFDDKVQETAKASFIWWGTADPDHHRGSDWAILRLTTPVGDKYGWMGVRAMDLSKLFNKDTIGLTGYSSDFRGGNTAGVESGCSFTGVGPGGSFLHNCDMSRGASGAPMYRAEPNGKGGFTYYVLAVNVADRRDGKDQSLVNIPYSDDHANVAAPASAFLPTLLSIEAADAKAAAGKQ